MFLKFKCCEKKLLRIIPQKLEGCFSGSEHDPRAYMVAHNYLLL